MKKPLELLLILTTLILSAGLTLGLTYAPCYSSLCSEEFFPYVTRLHIASYYAILASTGCFLFLRAVNGPARKLSTFYLVQRELPILRKRISLGGLLAGIWLIGLTLATTGFWLSPEEDFWKARTDVLEWPAAKVRLLVTGIIGHHADILLGLVIIPVSRNSLLGRVFALHQSTLLYAHKLLGYLFVVAAFAHGAAYYLFVGEYGAVPDDSDRKAAFDIDNPTLTLAETERRGGYYKATLPTGMLSLLFALAMVITSLPSLRRRSYNTFYYTHILGSLGIFFCASIHASTDFYFLLPGLILWLVDWAWRFFRGTGGLGKKVVARVENAGNGWYRINMPVSAKVTSQSEDVEKEKLPTHPLQSYYLGFPSISKLQNHAFTAAAIGSTTSGPLFLLQRAAGKKQKKLDKEWTWKLADLVRSEGDVKEFAVRVEGPYSPSVPEMETASATICIVGGTGLTGAYSLALWWLKNRSTDPNARFSLIWTVRYPETAKLKEWVELEKTVADHPSMTLIVHVSSQHGRLSPLECLQTQIDQHMKLGSIVGTSDTTASANYATWVYISGPEGLLTSVETACLTLQRRLNQQTQGKNSTNTASTSGLGWYAAKWQV